MIQSSAILHLETLSDDLRPLSRLISRGSRVSLTGDLGAGKTTIIRHLLWLWGAPRTLVATSPTFVYAQTYTWDMLRVHHLDLYRLRSFSEFEALDLQALVSDQDAIVLIEWGERFPELQSFLTMTIKLSGHGDTDDQRLIEWWQ